LLVAFGNHFANISGAIASRSVLDEIEKTIFSHLIPVPDFYPNTPKRTLKVDNQSET
jgi:hypothetical protein